VCSYRTDVMDGSAMRNMRAHVGIRRQLVSHALHLSDTRDGDDAVHDVVLLEQVREHACGT
jgi:hypothetical protein